MDNFLKLCTNPGGSEIFHICPDRPRGLHSPLYNGYTKYSAEDPNGLQLYLRLRSETAQTRHGLTLTFTNA